MRLLIRPFVNIKWLHSRKCSNSVFSIDLSSSQVFNKCNIVVKNTQVDHHIDVNKLIDKTVHIRRILGYEKYRINIWLCSERVISAYNKRWRSAEIRQKELLLLEENESVGSITGSSVRHEEHQQSGQPMMMNKGISIRGRKGKGSKASTSHGSHSKSLQSLKPTDILSFPALDISVPGKPVSPTHVTGEDVALLGDIIICPEYIWKQCRKDKQMDEDGYEYEYEEGEVGVNRVMSQYYTVQERVELLMIHGCVHLLGYDHETMQEWQQMTRIEQRIMNQMERPESGGI